MGELLELFVFGFVIYLLYKLVFELIVPVTRATSSVRSKIREMQQMQEEEIRRQQQPGTGPQPKNATTGTSSEDYIDFEELK